jgi:hypothetical protein
VAAPGRARAGGQITFGDVTCAPGWAAPQPGRDHFEIANQSSRVATVYLFRADSGAIVGTLRHVASGTVRRLPATLRAGRPYAWGCDLAGYPRHVSESQRALAQRQPGGSGPVVVPVQTEQLAGPLRAYRRYVAGRIARLHRQMGELRGAIVQGRLASARRAWERAHFTWLSIGQDDGASARSGRSGRSAAQTARAASAVPSEAGLQADGPEQLNRVSGPAARLAAVPFHGAHQAGITTTPPPAACFVACDVIAADRGSSPTCCARSPLARGSSPPAASRRTSVPARRPPTAGLSALMSWPTR